MQPTHSIEIMEVKRADRLLALHCSFVHRTREVLSVQHEKCDKACYGTEETLFWDNGQRRFVYSAVCP
jgi:hypothetical protein